MILAQDQEVFAQLCRTLTDQERQELSRLRLCVADGEREGE